MKKFIILATMFVIFGCSDNSVSADPTVPEETVTEQVTKPNPEETAPTYVSSIINGSERKYTCDDAIDWTGFDLSDLAMTIIIGNWYPFSDFYDIISMELTGHGYLSVSKTRTELASSGGETRIREAVTNLYIANGVDNPEQMEQDIANLYKLLNWTFKLKVESEKNDGKIWCNPIN